MESRRAASDASPAAGGGALGTRTIRDFGERWSFEKATDGFSGSSELLADAPGPLLDPSDIAGAGVAAVESGAARLVRMLPAAVAARVVAVELSDGVAALRRDMALAARARDAPDPPGGPA